MTRALLLLLLVIGTPASAQQHGVRFPARTWVTMTAATATLIANANASRVALVCTNTDTTDGINLGDATNKPSATAGAELRAGASITITATSAIWGYPVANTPAISCSEES